MGIVKNFLDANHTYDVERGVVVTLKVKVRLQNRWLLIEVSTQTE